MVVGFPLLIIRAWYRSRMNSEENINHDQKTIRSEIFVRNNTEVLKLQFN